MARSEGEDRGEPLEYAVSIQPEAELEMQEAYLWYEAKAHGLGAELLRAVEASLSAVARHPTAYPVVYKDARRTLLRRFPYQILYTVEGHTVEVMACYHTSRDPKGWQTRV